MIKREYRGIKVDLHSEDLNGLLTQIEFYNQRGFDTKNVGVIFARGLYSATVEKRVYLDEC